MRFESCGFPQKTARCWGSANLWLQDRGTLGHSLTMMSRGSQHDRPGSSTIASRRMVQRWRAEGKKAVLVYLAPELIAALDQLKAQNRLSGRPAALTQVLEEFFGIEESEGETRSAR